MDRRVLKTRKAIYEAFDHLLARYDYSKISIQDIIDEANVGRSTFYGHFETKDDLLNSRCKDLFEHIFNPNLNEEANCFIDSSSVKNKIVHILTHLLEHKDLIKGILSSEGSVVFIKFFRAHFNLIEFKINENLKNIPESFIRNQISASFIEMLRYWIDDKFKESPEVLTDYYLSMLPEEIV